MFQLTGFMRGATLRGAPLKNTKNTKNDAGNIKGTGETQEPGLAGKAADSGYEAEAPTQQENSPPAATVKPSRGRAAGTAKKAANNARTRGLAAEGSVSGAVVPGPAKPQDAPLDNEEPKEAPLAAPEPAQARNGRNTRPASKRNSAEGGALRTGDEIWQANLALARAVEMLADPEDTKKGRRRYKSPTLQEKLHKEWGGTYGERLEREFAALDADVEQPPAPKYEPATFLDEIMDSDGEAPQFQPQATTANVAQAKVAATAEDLGNAVEEPEPSAAAQAALAPARRGTAAVQAGRAGGRSRATGVAGKTATAAGAKVEPAAAAAATRRETREQPDEDVELVETAPPVGAEEREQEAPREQPARRKASGRKAVQAEPAAKAAPAPRAAAGRRPGKAQTTEPPAADQSEAAIAAPEAPPTAARSRKAQQQPSRAFGTTGTKSTALAATGASADGADDTVGGHVDTAPAVPVASALMKRQRESMAVTDQGRSNRGPVSGRLEEQQLLQEVEALRKQKQELENKNERLTEQLKQREGELREAKRQATEAEKVRGREASGLATAELEVEKLKKMLTDRDEKIAALRDEVKQYKAREAFMRKGDAQLQEFSASLMRFATQMDNACKARAKQLAEQDCA